MGFGALVVQNYSEEGGRRTLHLDWDEEDFIFATRAFHEVNGAPFRLYCDHFIGMIERTGDGALTITLHGGEGRLRRPQRDPTPRPPAHQGGD